MKLYEVIQWFTSFSRKDIDQAIVEKWTSKKFFDYAKLHENSSLIKGSTCGCKIDEIDNPLTQNVRRLDKIVDELAKGKKWKKY